MLNGEKFKDEIKKELDKHESGLFRIVYIKFMGCSDEIYHKTALFEIQKEVLEWLFSEYKEPIKLTKLEYEFLKHVRERGYKYIVRDRVSYRLYIFESEPIKCNSGGWTSGCGCDRIAPLADLFLFVKNDDKEPTYISDILNNCEIVEEK